MEAPEQNPNSIKVSNKDTRTTSIFNFEQISYVVLVFPSLTLNKCMPVELQADWIMLRNYTYDNKKKGSSVQTQ